MNEMKKIVRMEGLEEPFENGKTPTEEEINQSVLVKKLGELLNMQPNYDKEECPEFESYLEELEYHLQKNIFVDLPQKNFKTLSQTLLFKPKSSPFIYYLYRETKISNDSPWTVFQIDTTKKEKKKKN